jgi:hypothetical protein
MHHLLNLLPEIVVWNAVVNQDAPDEVSLFVNPRPNGPRLAVL